uniref:ATPase AAA-type core domain-containing protein n=1 Tax=Brassica oleracea var. oleracea TaxID=109376 RepID=A0A0D3AXP6_BRAOL
MDKRGYLEKQEDSGSIGVCSHRSETNASKVRNHLPNDLFIIGASNRPDLIDPALLRPGRFDKLLYVGVNADAFYRERKALTRKFKLSEDVTLYSVAKKCPSTFTGADMYALCADARFQAAKRKVLNSDSEDDSVPED